MKTLTFTILLFASLFTTLSAQTGPESDPEFQEDIAGLEAQLKDSTGFERIIDRIKANWQDLELSRRYINFLEEMHRQYPDIPKGSLSVEQIKAAHYNELAWNTANTDSELAFRQLDTAEQYARSVGFEAALWQTELGRGHAYQVIGDYENALVPLRKIYDHFSDPFDSAWVASVLYQIGICQLELGRLEESIESFAQTAELDEALGRNVYAYNMLGKAYRKARLYERSESAYQKAYRHWQEKGDQDGQSRALMNLGNLKMETGERDRAKELFVRSVQLDAGNEFALGYSTENLGNWYLEAGQYDSAHHFILRSYQIRKTFDNPKELAQVEHKLARVYMAKGQYPPALPLLQSAYKTVSGQGEQEKIRDLAFDLSRWYEAQGNYRQALQYKNAYLAAKDSLLNERIAQAVADVSEKYESAEKERTIEQLNTQNRLQTNLLRARQRQLLLVSIGSVLLIGLLIGIFGLYRRIRQQNGLIHKNLREKEILLKEIHHRVKNNLQMIASLLRIQSRNIVDEKAREAIREGTSRVRSMALIHEDLYKENDLSGVLMPEYLGKLAKDIFGIYNIAPGRIRLQTDIEPLRLDVDTVIPIGLIVNELLTNALKHAFAEDQPGIISLSLREQDEKLLLEVCDNGRGFANLPADGSFGLSMIETFGEKLEGELKILEQNGTCVRLQIGRYRTMQELEYFTP
jgi:two-component sensor histidine kinase